MRLGIVGLGVISRFYVSAVDALPGVTLAAVCDRDPVALDRFRGRLPCYQDHQALIEAGEVDAVVVTVPNDAHARVCQDVLAAGLPVCVEKPLALTLADGTALARAATDRGLTLFTAFHRRYNDNVLALLRGLARAAPIESVVIRYLERIEDHVGRDRWYLDATRCGGGCVADNGPNAFDLAAQFVGPVTLTGAEIGYDRAGTDRQAVLALVSAAGVPVTVELDWSHPGETKQVEVCCVDGSTRMVDMLDGHPEFKGSLWHEYVGVLRDFAAAVAAGEDRSAGGLAALELVDAVYRDVTTTMGRT